MWALDNHTAYAAERNWTRDRDGLHWWLVAVKATFDLGPDGRLKLADEQLPPVLMPEYFGEQGRSSLRYDSDLLAPKPGTDILVSAHAHAPRGKPASMVPVSLPRISLGFETRIGTRREEHGPRLTTVLVEPEARRLCLVWQSVLRVRAPEADYLDETRIFELKGKSASCAIVTRARSASE